MNKSAAQARGWISTLLVVAFLALAIATGRTQMTTAADIAIDHVILGIDDLARGMDEFSRLTGVVPQPGGQHPGRGTANALVSLGDGVYLEILAPGSASMDKDRAATVAHARLTPAGWALRTRDLPGLVARMRDAGFTVEGPTAGSRRKPDGALLEWQTAAVTGPGLELAPFFIQWAAGTPHPSTTSPTGCQLVSVGLRHPQPAPLVAFFRACGFHATVFPGDQPALGVVLQCRRGRVTFPEG